jgi:putative flippase GtrA
MTKKQSKAKKSKFKKLAVQFAEYMITGGVWFWSGYVIIVTLDNHIGLFWANLIGNAVGITLNFLLERYWVFRTNKPAKLGIATQRYIIYTALNAFLLNYFILYGLQEKFGIDPAIGQFIASGFFTVWNFYWYKVWVFKDMPKPRRTRHHA